MKFDNYMILEFPSRSTNEAFARSVRHWELRNDINSTSTKVKFDIKEIQKGCYTVDITAVKGGMNVLPMYLTGKRTQPLYCGKTNESYDYTIVMPSGMHYVGKNMMLSYEKPFGSFFKGIWQPPALPHRLQCSTIGRLSLNRRVRDENGCFP